MSLITGGGGDIGKAIAAKCVSHGGRVVLVDRSRQALLRAERELAPRPAQIKTVVADVTDESDVRRYVSEAREFLGGIDAFFNNAGIEGDARPITEYDLSAFRRVIEVNVYGVFLGLKHVLPLMAARASGGVVNVASVSGIRGLTNLSAYVASKHAVLGLTRTAALEVGGSGVRVNAICPAAVEGRMIHSITEKVASRATVSELPPVPPFRAFAERTPMGRLAQADEVADVAVFLASDAASFVNGAAWVIDGGRTAQ